MIYFEVLLILTLGLPMAFLLDLPPSILAMEHQFSEVIKSLGQMSILKRLIQGYLFMI